MDGTINIKLSSDSELQRILTSRLLAAGGSQHFPISKKTDCVFLSKVAHWLLHYISHERSKIYKIRYVPKKYVVNFFFQINGQCCQADYSWHSLSIARFIYIKWLTKERKKENTHWNVSDPRDRIYRIYQILHVFKRYLYFYLFSLRKYSYYQLFSSMREKCV